MLVYRDSTRTHSVHSLLDELARAANSCCAQSALEGLLRAGELECALADRDHPASPLACALSDAFAARYLGEADTSSIQLVQQLARANLPDTLTMKIPEGYAYYALSPVQYAQMARRWSTPKPARVAVIGVRSIGTSLSAVVRAALCQAGVSAQRMCVRPGGHPWDRQLQWSAAQARFVCDNAGAGAELIVVDEGPGMSGSTFLAVAEALEQCGVPAHRIHFFCSHQPDPAALVAPAAGERWLRYRSHAPLPQASDAADAIDLSGGAWRKHSYADPQLWPAVWTQRERVKHWYPAQRRLDKFEGLPPYGNEVLARARSLAHAGFGPDAQPGADGFVHYAFIAGRPACSRDLDATTLETLARYCSFRSQAFAAVGCKTDALEQMLRVNAAESLGVELESGWSLEVRRPIITDARMQPHEWRVDLQGKLYKTDGHSHGDDHVLPGPTDVCWDLAGAIVEWNMSAAQAECFVSHYRRASGDLHVQQRLPAFRAAYCALRCGENTFAEASAGAEERTRLTAAGEYYRGRLAAEIAPSCASRQRAQRQR